MEDVGISPENAFREDSLGDRSFISKGSLPFTMTSSYKRKWKLEFDELCQFKHAFKPEYRKSSVKRYFGTDFQKDFNRAERKQNLHDMSGHLKKEWRFQNRPLIRFVHDFTEESDLKDDENEESDFKHHKIQLRTRDYNESLRFNPHNVDLWLEYIDFQDMAMADSEFTLKENNEDDPELNKKMKKKMKKGSVLIRSKAIIEKKLSILKTALDHNPKSVILSVKRLNLSKEIMDSSTLNRQWKELLFLFPGDIQIWDHYLSFLTSHFTTFTLKKITNAYKECFQKLQTMAGDAYRTDQKDIEDQMSLILIKLWHLWARSGYRERSVALFQALMELNLNAPNFPGYYSTQDKLATFEPFWDSAVPRFGEKDAPGWTNAPKGEAYKGVKCEDQNDEEDEMVETFGNKVDDIELWLRLELLRESNHCLPLRVIPEDPDEDDEIEDRERIILFDKIDGFLYQFKDQNQVFKLFLAFLHFLGLDLFQDDPEVLGVLGSQSLHDWLGINHPEVIDQDDFQSSGVLLQTFGRPPKTAFIKAIFQQATRSFGEPFKTQIMLMYLKYESENYANDISEGQDVSKKAMKKAKAKEIKAETMQFLQGDQTNTRVYVSYAMALNKLEGYKAAKKVFELAFEGRKKAFNDQLVLLYVHSAMVELKQGQRDNAMWLLALMTHKRPYQPCHLDKVELLAFANSAREKAEEMLHVYVNGRFGKLKNVCRFNQCLT